MSIAQESDRRARHPRLAESKYGARRGGQRKTSKSVRKVSEGQNHRKRGGEELKTFHRRRSFLSLMIDGPFSDSDADQSSQDQKQQIT
ncbi:hypothetical protein PHISCL_03590 [Aspergillus sclerotialis]|uniref:Uncharacterized protein n=1 Tax=Aspergillus sclerotialis TaxID=2070753 RepID=A0A3A2ZXK8_9EURO|nr:hypothetical protein PHISCL_03590 [Aspergillus sclerotialis]